MKQNHFFKKNASDWLKRTFNSCLDRDPEEALRDIKTLHKMIAERVRMLNSTVYDNEQDKENTWRYF